MAPIAKHKYSVAVSHMQPNIPVKALPSVAGTRGKPRAPYLKR